MHISNTEMYMSVKWRLRELDATDAEYRYTIFFYNIVGRSVTDEKRSEYFVQKEENAFHPEFGLFTASHSRMRNTMHSLRTILRNQRHVL
jgi:hypothetical protein